jgi:5,10-methylene-tetrahydrofolate dehydrogenase/methenyl tetrahydrofolate cyclohydrolase
MNASISDLVTTISALNEDNNIDAIMVERNAAAEACRSFRINAISSLVSAAKDVDGEKPSTLPGSFGKDVAAMYFDHFVVSSAAVSSEGDFDSTLSTSPAMLPCTVGGVFYLLDHYRYSDKLPGSTAVVIGRSRKLGTFLFLIIFSSLSPFGGTYFIMHRYKFWLHLSPTSGHNKILLDLCYP